MERPDPRTLSRVRRLLFKCNCQMGPVSGGAGRLGCGGKSILKRVGVNALHLGPQERDPRGKRTSPTEAHPARAFLFFSAENISPLKNALDGIFFASRKYLRSAHGAGVACFSEEKSPSRAFFATAKHRREVVTMLSTQKVTENLQKPPLICLTGVGAVPISCGQGSGHPHPVVVDNVSGSFGNLVSPEAFCRL